jgi:hypothetical protein
VARLPIDGRTSQPMVPQEQPGYYPGFHTLDQQKFWDEATRKVVLNRVNNVPPIRFFTTKEALLSRSISMVVRLLSWMDARRIMS